MNCAIRSELQAEVEAVARELSRAIQEALVAIEPFHAIAAGNRIEGAECGVRLAGKALIEHRAGCPECAERT